MQFKVKNGVKLPTNFILPPAALNEALTIIERDIHQRVKGGRRLDDKPQTKNAPSTLAFKRKHGLGRTPLQMGWTPRGYHRFLAKFPRKSSYGCARMWLARSDAPGGFPGQREVATILNRGVKRRATLFKGSGGRTAGGAVTRVRYHVPFGISNKAGLRVVKRLKTLLRRQLAAEARRARTR